MSATSFATAPSTPASSGPPTVPLSTRIRRTVGLSVAYGVAFFLLASGVVPCSFASLTHHPCPGCGTTRSALALFHGDFAGALRWNPLGPFVVVAFAVLASDALRLVARDGDLRAFAASTVSSWALRVVLVSSILQLVVWVARSFGYLGGPVPVG